MCACGGMASTSGMSVKSALAMSALHAPPATRRSLAMIPGLVSGVSARPADARLILAEAPVPLVRVDGPPVVRCWIEFCPGVGHRERAA